MAKAAFWTKAQSLVLFTEAIFRLDSKSGVGNKPNHCRSQRKDKVHGNKGVSRPFKTLFGQRPRYRVQPRLKSKLVHSFKMHSKQLINRMWLSVPQILK